MAASIRLYSSRQIFIHLRSADNFASISRSKRISYLCRKNRVIESKPLLSTHTLQHEEDHIFRNNFRPYSHKFTSSFDFSSLQTLSRTSTHIRQYSTKQSDSEDKVKPPSRPRQYALNKVVTILSNSQTKLEDRLEKKLPAVFHVYKTAKTGIQLFIADAKEFYRINVQLWGGQSLADFPRRDLELYRQCSQDLPVMTIALLISLAPGGVLIFPLAYMFPRLLLSHHFWTKKQKADFTREKVTNQLRHHGKLLHMMERKLLKVSSHEDRLNLQSVLRKVEKQETASATDILKLRRVFEEKPFAIDFLSLTHRYHLSRALGLSMYRGKMVRESLLLHFIDVAIVREGVQSMSDDDLNRACVWRGLNPEGLQHEEKTDFLLKWTAVSSIVHESSISLLLHLPVLMGNSRGSVDTEHMHSSPQRNRQL